MTASARGAKDAVALLRAVARGDAFDGAAASLGLSLGRARELLDWAAGVVEEAGLQPPPEQGPTERHLPLESNERVDVLRIFTDGAARGNPGPAGAGAVLFDEDGNPVDSVGKFLGRTTNNVAEYEGVILGLERALELGARRVEIFCDSELLVHQLSGRYRVRAEHLRAPFERVRGLLRKMESHSLRHVPREKNKDADALANRAIDERL